MNRSNLTKNWLQYASNQGIQSTSVTNSAFLLHIVATPMSDTPIETTAHAWIRLSCACSIEQILESITVALAMHDGTRGMRSMSSSYIIHYTWRPVPTYLPYILFWLHVQIEHCPCRLAMSFGGKSRSLANDAKAGERRVFSEIHTIHAFRMP
jgi:hypothetical protein